MPKQKTRKSLIKRIKITKSGKLLYRSTHLRHLRRKKSKRRIRRLKRMKQLKGGLARKVRKQTGA